MSNRAVESIELTLRGADSVPFTAEELIPASWALPSPRAWPYQRRRRRRPLLAETEMELQRGPAPKLWRAKLAVVLYTLARIVANLTSVFLRGRAERSYPTSVIIPLICDGFVRPLVTGFGLTVLYCRFERMSEPSLHLWTRRALYCLASFHCDVAVFLWGSQLTSTVAMYAMYAWESSCNAMQMQMTNLKLHALGLKQIARICQVLTSLMVCGWVVCCAIAAWIGDLEGQRSQKTSSDVLREDAMRAFAWIGVACTLLGLPLQFLGLCVAAGRALSVGWHDSDIRHAACLLYVNSTLQLLGPILSMRATIVFTNATVKIVDWQNPQQTSGTMLLTLDMTLQVLNVLLLSGLIGPQQWQNPMAAFQKLATLQGFGLTSTKRIAFSGRVNETARDCIVSFPGKYSEEWDQAVSVAKTQEAISLACVFLTDRASGLGVHCENPDSPGECWCRAIYGSLPAST